MKEIRRKAQRERERVGGEGAYAEVVLDGRVVHEVELDDVREAGACQRGSRRDAESAERRTGSCAATRGTPRSGMIRTPLDIAIGIKKIERRRRRRR
jgi:hypothetical protein